MAPTASASERVPGVTIEGDGKGIHRSRTHRHMKMQRKSILGMEGPIGPILCGVQGLTCSPPIMPFSFPPSIPLGLRSRRCPRPHTARLLDDEILTPIQALENASLSVASPTPASTTGHVSRGNLRMECQLTQTACGPRTGRGFAARTLWRDCTSRRDLRLSKGSILRNAHGEDRLLGSSIWFIL